MSELFKIIIYTALAGACIPLGGSLARISKLGNSWLENEFRHFIIAFGGGILLGAVSVVLVPQGLTSLNGSMIAIPLFLAGSIVFFLIERFLGLRRRESPQLMGMILDYIPEAAALGGLIAIGSHISLTLAILIAIQNLPEGFNAYIELEHQKHSVQNTSSNKILISMFMLVPLGPIAGVLGYLFLSEYQAVLGGLMLFASGGIIYLIFQDIAPQSKLEKHWAPPLGAVFGFSLALASEMLVTH